MTIAIIGNFKRNYGPHYQLGNVLRITSEVMSLETDIAWLHPDTVWNHNYLIQEIYDGFILAPGGTFHPSYTKVLEHCLTSKKPLLTTGSAYQHILHSFSQSFLLTDKLNYFNMQQWKKDMSYNIYCTDQIALNIGQDTQLLRIYQHSSVNEAYYCNFGLYPIHLTSYYSHGWQCSAIDQFGEVRAFEKKDHPFLLALLYSPQTSTLSDNHPVFITFLQKVWRMKSTNNLEFTKSAS